MAALYDVWEHGYTDSQGNGRDGEVEESENTDEAGWKQGGEGEASEDKGGKLMFSYTILTTSASPRIRWLHDR